MKQAASWSGAQQPKPSELTKEEAVAFKEATKELKPKERKAKEKQAKEDRKTVAARQAIERPLRSARGKRSPPGARESPAARAAPLAQRFDGHGAAKVAEEARAPHTQRGEHQ